ncbi:hypothetical protein RHO14_12035 [Orbus wheelerorum]|uniref:hypothetical protein n=1 Tax=Orbus wheelerorum TaxID=3074111 RepID=UPI00370DB6FE
MKRLIILCVLLLTFSAGAAEKVIEQQGSWSIIEQDNWSKPRYILSAEDYNGKFKLICSTDNNKILFAVYYYHAQRLDNLSKSTELLVSLDRKRNKNNFFGTMFNYSKNIVFWTNNLDYSGYFKDYDQEKAKLTPIFSQLFKQFASATGNITFTAKGEGDTLYQASLSSEGLPVMFDHFAKYCGADFMTAFDIPVEEK